MNKNSKDAYRKGKASGNFKNKMHKIYAIVENFKIIHSRNPCRGEIFDAYMVLYGNDRAMNDNQVSALLCNGMELNMFITGPNTIYQGTKQEQATYIAVDPNEWLLEAVKKETDKDLLEDCRKVMIDVKAWISSGILTARAINELGNTISRIDERLNED